MDSGVGVYVGSEDAYLKFGKLLNKVIELYHGHKENDLHKSDWNSEHLQNLESLDDNYCISTRVRVARNV